MNVIPKKTSVNVKKNPITTVRIWKFATEFQLRYNLQKDKKQFGMWMRNELVSLGPAFIKIGQFFSTRIDLFGKDTIRYLEDLQDSIEPMPFDYIEQVLHEEYDNYHDIFDEIDPIPLASASIGQVYRGKLKNKQDIVLKIQKPNIEEEISNDLNALVNVNSIFKNLGFQQARDFDAVLEQYKNFLANEVNYKKEANYMMYFRDKLKNQNVYIPKPLSQSTRRVLVMERVDSVKINDLEKLQKLEVDTEEIANNLISLFLYQIVDIGSVHCDPHPGNIGVREDGTLILYDFGNVAKFTRKFQNKINNLVFSIYQKDTDEFLDLLVELNIIQPNSDLDTLELKAFFRYFFNYLENLDIEQLKTTLQNSDLLIDSNVKVKVDPNFLALFRVFSLIDGTCILLNPNINYIATLTPYANMLFANSDFVNYRIQKDVSKIRDYSKMINSSDQNILRVNYRFTNMNNRLNEFGGLMFLLFICDNLNEPGILSLLIPLFGSLIWYQSNKNKD